MRLASLLCCAGVVGFAVVSPVSAQLLDVSPFATATVEHDSNLLRASGEDAAALGRRNDTITSLAVGLTAEFNPGLQAFRLTGLYRPVWYQHFEQFDHQAHELDARWDWEAGRRFDGNINLATERAIDDFANRSTPEAGFVRRQRVRALGGYNLSPRVRLEAEGRVDRRDGSGAADSNFDLREYGLVVGAFYRGVQLSRAGFSVSVSDGEFPNRAPGTNLATEYQQTSLDGQLVWSPSPVSDLDLTIGYTQREQEPTSTRDFSGLTGRLEYRRSLSVKTNVSLLAYRRIYSAELQDANLTIDDGLRISLDWEWSYKTRLRAALERREVEFEAGGALAASGSQLDDEIDLVTLEASWQALERLGLRLALEHDSRRSSDQARDYDALVGRFEVRLGF